MERIMTKKKPSNGYTHRQRHGLVAIALDCLPEERDLIRKAAALAGFRSMTAFCRATVVEAAQKVFTQESQKSA